MKTFEIMTWEDDKQEGPKWVADLICRWDEDNEEELESECWHATEETAVSELLKKIGVNSSADFKPKSMLKLSDGGRSFGLKVSDVFLYFTWTGKPE